jgi:hypothetical protein
LGEQTKYYYDTLLSDHMPVTIEQLPIEDFYISMTKRIDATDVLEKFEIQMGKHKEKESDRAIVLTKYLFNVTTIRGTGDLKMSFTFPFMIYPIHEIGVGDIYDCIIMMRANIKEITDVIFQQHDYVPDISIYPLDEMTSELSNFLSSLKSLE